MKLTGANPRAGDSFGAGSAILDRDTVAIGAAGAQLAGSVSIFKRAGGAWSQHAQLLPSSPEDAQLYGIDIAVNGNSMVVGAAQAASAGGARTGALYVYRRNSANVWSQEARVDSPDNQGRLFGTQVAISGSSIVAGAPAIDPNLPPIGGAAWLFQGENHAWSTKAKFKPSDATPFDDFGNFVAIDRTTVLIGAVGAPLAPGGTQEGAAYVFTVST